MYVCMLCVCLHIYKQVEAAVDNQVSSAIALYLLF